MQVTVTRGKGEKLHIHVDGTYTFTTNLQFWYAGKFREGDWTEEELLDVQHEAGCDNALHRALRILERRDHSRQELFLKVRQKETEAAAQYAIDRVEEMGLLDDAAYGEKLAHDLADRKGYSKTRIAQELRYRGIDREIVEQVTENLELEPEEQIAALLAGKYARKMQDESGQKRVFQALLRLGYPYGAVRKAMEIYETEERFNQEWE